MASNQTLLDRTEAVYRQLRSMRRRFRLSAWITLIVGGLLLALVAFYYTYGYREISQFRDPTYIVALAGQMIDDQVPAMRRTAEEHVKQNAPAWAKQASEQALKAIPPLREQVEKLALEQSDQAIAKIDTIGEQRFRKILNDNRETVQNAINQLKNDEDISEGAVLALREAIEKEFQIDADSQAAALVTMVSDMNANMDKLFDGENLSREQKAERRVLMLARRLHVERLGGMTFEDLADTLPPALLDHVKEREEKQLKKEESEHAQKAAEEMIEVAKVSPADVAKVEEKTDAPAPNPEEAAKPKAKPAEKKEAPAEAKPAEKPKEEAKPAEKPKEEAKPAEKPEEAAKPADKPEEAKKAPAEEKPADKPKEEAKPAEKPADAPAPAKEDKPAEKPEEK